ncbi:MAG: hypothetical protein HY682_05315 [Chloroflexi bacterium]|nr:hypothetical protein [Chloroflexota bacterium]
MRAERKAEIQFESFWAPARRVLQFARAEAVRLGSRYLGTEHLLLGMLSDAGCPAERILSNIGVTPGELCSEIEGGAGHAGRPEQFENGLTFRANLVIELAVEEALRTDAAFVGSEHFLIAILREGGGVAVRALHENGVDLEAVRTEADKMRRFRIWRATAGDIGLPLST